MAVAPRTQALRVNKGGDTTRKMTDAINNHAQLIDVGLFQTRTVAELADEPHEAGRTFYCPDNATGACLAVSNGTAWKRLVLGTTVA